MPQEVDHKTIPFLRQKRREILSTHTHSEKPWYHTVRNTNTNAQLLSSIHARKKNMLTPNGCETLVFSKKRKNTDAQLLRFKKTLDRFGFSNETKREEKETGCSPRTAAKVARNPERLRNPSFQQHNNAQLLSSRNAKTRMLSFSGSRKHLTGSSFPTKRNEKKKRPDAHPERLRK